jgi:cell division septation protein DedD
VTDITQDAADSGFHEIQLSGKQLVFLFMATTVVSVVIFLCGVLVGRNVQSERASDTAAALTTPVAQPGTSSTPVTEPSAAQPSAAPAEPPSPAPEQPLTYPQRLDGEGSPVETLKQPGAASAGEPRAETTKPETAKPETTKPETAKSETSAPTPAAAKPAASKSTSEPAAGGARPGRWVVQLVALRDRGAATAIVQRLSGKGYPAFIVSPSASTPNQVFKVQVGRYDDRSQAEQVSRRLEKEEKFRPWISR